MNIIEKKDSVEELLDISPFSISEKEKSPIFMKALLQELSFHYENNDYYRSFCKKKQFDPRNFQGELKDIPVIAVSVFKELGEKLNSVSRDELKLILQSSATSGIPSTVVLDKMTSKRQAKAMIKVMQDYIGRDRRPFLVADIPPKSENLKLLGARFAAIGGYLNFASSAEYILNISNDNGFVFNVEATKQYLEKIEQNKSVVLFGFTYILYSSILQVCLKQGIKFNLPANSKIIHIGGWKKLENEKVSKEDFNKIASEVFGIQPEDVIDVYGFTEQMGLNYPDCICGSKHVPLYSEIIVRDPGTGIPLPDNEVGVLSFISPIPHSYPGNIVQTDDIGMIVSGTCSAGRLGKRFKILGRLKKAEIRGCGDILATKVFSKPSNSNSNNEKSNLEILFHANNEVVTSDSDLLVFDGIVSDLQKSHSWIKNQPIDALIGLVSEVAKKWRVAEGELSELRNVGLGFLANWCSAEHLNLVATFGLRGDRRYIDSFQPYPGMRKQFLRSNSRGLVCHWLAGNVQILGMFALIQSILTKNVNLLKISSRDDGAFLKLINSFKDLSFKTKSGYEIFGDDLLKTISIVYFPHKNYELGELMSKKANVRIAWGGREAVESVSSYPKKYDTEDVIFGPKLSYSVIAKEMIENERMAKKVARKVAVDVSIFDQTGCASPHNLYIESSGNITPENFCELLNQALKKTSFQIIATPQQPEQLASVHSIRGLYDFTGKVWGSPDLTWTVLYDPKLTLNQPVYSRVIVVHPVEHINDALLFVTDDIQTIGLGAQGEKALKFAEMATKAGVSRCPELGKMLNFESPWDGIILMDRLVKWNTMGGPII